MSELSSSAGDAKHSRDPDSQSVEWRESEHLQRFMGDHGDAIHSDQDPTSEPIHTELAVLHNTKDETVVGHGEYERSLAVQDGAGDIEAVEPGDFQNGTRGAALREACDLLEETEEPNLRGFHYPEVEARDTALGISYNCQPEAADPSRAVSEPCGIQATRSGDAGAVVRATRRSRAELVSYELMEPRVPEAAEVDGAGGEVHGFPVEMDDVQLIAFQRPGVTVESRSSPSIEVEGVELKEPRSLGIETGRIKHGNFHHPRTEVTELGARAENLPGSQLNESSDASADNGGFYGPQAEVEGREFSEPRTPQTGVALIIGSIMISMLRRLGPRAVAEGAGSA
ncbi:hypothetical protein NM688_g6612 [Phlebia brevispora]|uniref:Uncharacterized protein n=1 Tax=Phlebia brevispora TaxID=194682 RepID=A0ACC1SEB1_9APHY|nr:hypothetical protein NM688_g6612 [Phlebia brevispora]